MRIAENSRLSSRHPRWLPSARLPLAVMLVASIVLAGCATTAAMAPVVERLTTATYAPTQTVDVLAAKPAGDFVPLARLTLDDPTGSATRAQLLAQLSAVARRMGANALVVESVAHDQSADVAFNPAGGQIEQSTHQGIRAMTVLAIRYTQSL